MSLYQGSSIVTNGLQFYYDMNNKKSYVGPPSTNDVVAVTWSGDGTNQTQFTAGSTLVTDANLKYRDLETYLWAPASSLNCYLNGGDFGASTSTTWTFSCYIRREDGQPISSLSVYLYTTTSDAAAGTITDVGGGWYRVHRTKVGTIAAVSLAGFTGFAGNVKYYLSGAMLTKTDYPVYPLDPLATRSNTQSIVDLTNNNIITATSLTYNANDTFSFNGSSTYALVNNSNTLSDTDSLSIDLWFRSTDVQTRVNDLIGKGSSDADEEYCILVNNFIYFDIGAGTGPYTQPSYTFLNNTWYHIVCTHERVASSSSLKIYINGILLSSGVVTPTATPNDNALPVSLGRRYYNSDPNLRTLNGSLPSVKIYNKVLTATEVNQNFNAHRGRYGI